MYLAKDKGKNNYQFYDCQLDRLASRIMKLENGLRKAVYQDQLMLYYQLHVDLSTGKIIGVEALIRWRHPKCGMISPCEFILLAEETLLSLLRGLKKKNKVIFYSRILAR